MRDRIPHEPREPIGGRLPTYRSPRLTRPIPAPTRVGADGIIGGIFVKVARPSFKNWALTRVRIKPSPRATPIAVIERKDTNFEATGGLVPGAKYYADAQYEDNDGNVSGWSNEVSATARRLTSDYYGDGTVETIHIVQDAITGLEILEVSDATGASTTSATFVDIPGFSVPFTLQRTATVLTYCTIDAYAYTTASGAYVVGVGTQLVIDGSAAPGSVRRALYNEVDSGGAPAQYMYLRGTLAVVTSRQLQAGAHTIKAQFRREGSDAETAAVVYDRILGVQIFKR